MRVLKKKWPPIGMLIASVLFAGCVGSGVGNYEEFKGAVDSEASCRQLIGIRDNFDGTAADKDRIERDLRALGCTSKDSERNDL